MKNKILQMKRVLSAALFVLLLSVTGMTKANPVDLRTVREVGMKFMNANTNAPLRSADDLELVTTYNISRGDAAFYVFNTPNGFVIVSADDCVTPILGYSNEGQFDIENIPIQLQDYLQGFVEQIQYGIENHLEADEQTARQWELVRSTGRLTNNRSNRTVEPLLTTTWGQGYPYNMYVPSGCPTGCVATAMAQIMKYWEWPVQGTGEHSYQWNGQTLSANFGETIYDWDNMLDDYYDNPGTPEQEEAVATLMWHCGVSVNMDYTPYGSSAGLKPSSLINYFSYSDEMSSESRDFFSDASWKARLKDCLSLGRPVYYRGVSSSDEGHAFVCDGYDSNELFHFNWGWGSIGDGYFAIGALNVYSYDFNFFNGAIFNIHPEGETTNYTINVTVNNEEFGTASEGGTFAHGENVTLSATANDGYGFCYWEENGGIASTDPNYSFIANYNRDLVAVFAGPFIVTTSTEEGGTVSGGGSFYYGEPCLVTATADEGYVFTYWTDDGDIFSYNPNYTFVVTGETHLVAHFVVLSDDIIVFADGYVKDICVANWDTNGDGLLSYDEAAAVTNDSFNPTGYWEHGPFYYNQDITSFNELQYFTNLTTIGDYAFFHCRNLTLLTIPSSIIAIGNYAFSGCSSLIGPLIIPNSVTSIGKSAFFDCSNLTGTLTIPNSVTSIGDYTFYGCSNLTSLIIPNAVTLIDNYAFYGCNGLKSMAIYAETPPLLGLNVYYNVANNIQLYVPCNAVESYQASEGWNVFSNVLGMCSGIITVVSDPLEGGETTGSGSYEGGTFCTVAAIPNAGYVFNNWTKDDEVVSYFSTYTMIVTESAEYMANFETVPNSIVIGSPTNTNAYLPTYSYSPYSMTQQIYTVDEMGGEATEISSVSFFNTGTTNSTRTMNVYMVSTDKTVFNSVSDWIPVTESNLVFSGIVVIPACDWATVYFSTPFNYDGSSNVALIVDDNSSSWYSGLSCRTFSTNGNQALRTNSGTNYNPTNPSSYMGTLMTMKNQVIFGVPSYDYTITATANPTDGGTISGGGPCYLNQPVTLMATSNAGYVFNNWTKDGEVVSYLSSCTLTVTESAECVANFEAVPNSIVVGNPTNTNVYLPTYSYYSLSEQIYTANEMGGTACQISSVSFFNTGTTNRTRTMSVYMVSTDKTVFDSVSDWIPVTESDLVFSGSVDIPACDWATVYFSTPFNYDGLSNVALIVDDNTNSYNTSTSYRTFMTGGKQAIRVYGSGTNYDPTNPTGYTGMLMSMKNQIVFGIPSYDYTVTVSVGLDGGGTVSGGSQCYLNQPIALTATPNAGYVFNNWTKDGEVVSYLSPYTLTVTESAEYVANFEAVPNSIVIGSPTNTNVYLPIYSHYRYSLSEQIYTSSEMGGTACQISSVSFFNTGSYSITRNMSVYMISTNKTSFDSISDWIPVLESDLVFSGNVTFTAHGWATVYFSTPFNYDGSSNVALIVDDNSYNNANTYTNCRTFSTEGNQTIRIYGSGTNYNPINPSSYTGTLMSMKNQVIFRWPSTITATANPTGGGTVSGSGSYAYGATCTLTATPNAGYYFLNWTENGTVVSYDATYSFTVDGDRNLVANFIEGESNCTIVFDLYSSWGSGWYGNYLVVDYGNGNTEQLTLSNGSTISYSREVATGSTIALSWIAGSYTYQCSFDVKFENGVPIYHGSSLSSSFQQELNINCAVATAPRVITAVAEPEEGGTIEGAGTYDSGTAITLTATPNDGYSFCFWSENGQQVSTDASYSFIVSSDRDLVARFSLPLTVSVTTNMASGGTVTGTGVFNYGNTCTLTATPNEGYLFLNWSKNGVVVSCNATYSFSVTEDTDLEAVFMRLEGTLIGQGESTNSYLPSFSNYNYTLSQQIYTPNEIGEAGNITTISYFNAGITQTHSYDIYMVHTDKSIFGSNTDWITVSEDDLIFSGNVTMTQGYWTTITLDTPFSYNGTSNLAIVIDDNKGSSYYLPNMACRVFSTTGYQAIRIYSDRTNYDPSNPSSYSGTLMNVKNQIVLGITPSTVEQTIVLSQGWNWFSTYIEANDPVAMLDMLKEGLGDNAMQIQSTQNMTEYDSGDWFGDLDDLGISNEQTYMIEMSTPCTVELQGMTANPANHVINIKPGWNWIGFPSAEPMDVVEAFAGFEVEEDDQIMSQNSMTEFDGEEWFGDVETLEPGQGYMYYSNSLETKTLIFQTIRKWKQ